MHHFMIRISWVLNETTKIFFNDWLTWWLRTMQPKLNIHTNLGAIREDKVMVFSGGISAFVLPIITRQSPEVTALTFPLSHPVAPAADAMPSDNPTITVSNLTSIEVARQDNNWQFYSPKISLFKVCNNFACNLERVIKITHQKTWSVVIKKPKVSREEMRSIKSNHNKESYGFNSIKIDVARIYPSVNKTLVYLKNVFLYNQQLQEAEVLWFYKWSHF